MIYYYGNSVTIQEVISQRTFKQDSNFSLTSL
jgi:hypothetical protein